MVYVETVTYNYSRVYIELLYMLFLYFYLSSADLVCYRMSATSYKDGELKLYDSMFSGKLTESLEKHIAKIYSPVAQNGCLVVTVVLFSNMLEE